MGGRRTFGGPACVSTRYRYWMFSSSVGMVLLVSQNLDLIRFDSGSSVEKMVLEGQKLDAGRRVYIGFRDSK